jgi:hypothetical protein
MGTNPQDGPFIISRQIIEKLVFDFFVIDLFLRGCQIFVLKIPIRVYFGGPWKGNCWYNF